MVKVSKEECEHEWKKFKETVRVERTEAQLRKGQHYTGNGAHFIVKACMKCKKKQRVDYIVEQEEQLKNGTQNIITIYFVERTY